MSHNVIHMMILLNTRNTYNYELNKINVMLTIFFAHANPSNQEEELRNKFDQCT